MITRNALAKVISLAIIGGALATCPAGYAQNQKPVNRAIRQLPSLNTTDQSDLKPTVMIKMQIQGVPGGQDIDVFGYEQETTMTASVPGGGGGGAGKFIPGPVTVSKRIDDVSPFLNKIHVEGSHIRQVTLQWFRLDPSGKSGAAFFTITLNDALIAGIHRSLPNQQDPALARLGEVEAISFVYNDFDVTTGN